MKNRIIGILCLIIILSSCQSASFLSKKYDAKGKWNFHQESAHQTKTQRNIVPQDEMTASKEEEGILIPESSWIMNPDTDITDSEEVISEEYVPMTEPFMDTTIVEDASDYALPYDSPKPKKKGMLATLKFFSMLFELAIAFVCVLGIIALIAAISLGSITGVMLVLAILGIIALFAIGLIAALLALFTIVMVFFMLIFKLGGAHKIGG